MINDNFSQFNSTFKAKKTSQNLDLNRNSRLASESKQWRNYLNISKFMKLPLDFSLIRSLEDSGFVFDKVRITSRTFYGNGNFMSK